MSEWKKVRLGDVCEIEKGSTGIASAIPGEYPLVVTAAERKTSDSYQFDCAAVCIPLVSSKGHGVKALNNVHYQEGKFALGTILCAVIPKNPEELSARYLHQYLQFNKDRVLVPLMKGAANVSLAVKDVASVEIPVPSIDNQKYFADLLNKVQLKGAKIQQEFEKQKDILKKLRQSVLQDAIEGKLTEDWRKKHPVIKGDINYDAEALYNHIQQEKQKLIAAGKIKKEKPLPEIKVEEMSLHVPNNWLYVRLGDVAEGFQYGTASKSESEGKCPVLRMGNVQNGIVDWEKLVYTNDDDEIEKYKLTRDDLIFNRTNSREWVGKTCIYNSDRQAIYAGYLVRFRVLSQNAYFANYVLNSKYHREWCNEVKIDALGQSNINAEKLKNFIFPIAPLAEQNEIVARVESCLKKIDELELQIATRETYAKTLLQTTLHSTFQEG